MCGSLIGVVGIEADGKVLVMVTKNKMVGSLWSVNYNVMVSLMVFSSISSSLWWWRAEISPATCGVINEVAGGVARVSIWERGWV